MRLGVLSFCFEFKHLVYTNRATQSKASFKGYNVFFRPDFPQEPSSASIQSCLPPAFPEFWLRFTGKALLERDYSFRYHTECSPIITFLKKTKEQKIISRVFGSIEIMFLIFFISFTEIMKKQLNIVKKNATDKINTYSK